MYGWGADGLSDSCGEGGALGAAVVVGRLSIDLADPFRKAEAAKERLDALDDVGDAARARGAAGRQQDEVRAEEDGSKRALRWTARDVAGRRV